MLPRLLNVFYYETLFIVYELLRDNLYHIYKYIEECHAHYYDRPATRGRSSMPSDAGGAARSNVIHCDLKPENT